VTDQPNTQALVWRYGARKGLTIPPEVEVQLRLAHELREHLVELAYEREHAIARVWGQHPDVAGAQQEATKAQAQLDELLTAASEERRRGRRRAISHGLRDRIIEARQARRDSKAQAKRAKEHAYAQAAPALHEIRDAERKARKAAYGEFVQKRGLYWATFNDVARKHDLADRGISTARKQGRPAQFRHHRYDGTGRIAVQLQRAQGQPDRTAELLSTPDSPWWNVLRLPAVAATGRAEWAALSRAEQRRRGRGSITVRTGSHEDRSPVLWDIPTQIHRPVPPTAEVLQAEVIVTRVATDRRVAVNLTIRADAPAPLQGPKLAVDIGWRSMPDGAIRVAYWRGSSAPPEPIRVPAHLEGVLRIDATGREGEVCIPSSWRRLHQRTAKIQSGRAKDLERIKASAASHLERYPQLAEDLALKPSELKRWRSPGRVVNLFKRLEDIAGADELSEQIRAWERRDRHLWQWESFEREQLIGRRRDAYRAIAALLAEAWPCVVLESRFVAKVTSHPPGEDTDRHQAAHARAQATLAAPGELAQAFHRAAASRGGAVTELDPRLTTRRHYECGEVLPADVDTATGVMVECPQCKAVFDEDRNAALNMLEERVVRATTERSTGYAPPAPRRKVPAPVGVS
jgi:hypothetical protein